MSKHTAGPWLVEQDRKTPIYVSPAGRHEQIAICNVLTIDEDDSESGDWINGEQTKANAKLIASAPDLLEALQKIQFRCECFIDDGRSMKVPSVEAIKAICDAAITKAIQ